MISNSDEYEALQHSDPWEDSEWIPSDAEILLPKDELSHLLLETPVSDLYISTPVYISIDADMRFHGFIYELAGNTFILDSMEAHWNHVRRVMSDILIVEKNQKQIWEEHAAILDAVLAGDARMAETLARQHVETASKWLQQEIHDSREPLKRSGGATG